MSGLSWFVISVVVFLFLVLISIVAYEDRERYKRVQKRNKFRIGSK